MFDFVNAARPGRWRLGRRRQARLDDAQAGAATHAHHACLNRDNGPKSRIGDQPLRNNSGSLAIFAAILRASSLLSSLAAESPTGPPRLVGQNIHHQGWHRPCARGRSIFSATVCPSTSIPFRLKWLKSRGPWSISRALAIRIAGRKSRKPPP